MSRAFGRRTGKPSENRRWVPLSEYEFIGLKRRWSEDLQRNSRNFGQLQIATWNNEDPTFSTIFNLSLKSPPPLISIISLPSSKPPSPSPMSTMSPSPSHCHINMKPSVECSRTLWDTDCNWSELVIIQIRHTRLQISSEKRPFSGTGWYASGVPLSPARKNSARLSASFDWEVSGVGSTFNI